MNSCPPGHLCEDVCRTERQGIREMPNFDGVCAAREQAEIGTGQVYKADVWCTDCYRMWSKSYFKLVLDGECNKERPVYNSEWSGAYGNEMGALKCAQARNRVAKLRGETARYEHKRLEDLPFLGLKIWSTWEVVQTEE